jgi:hypothetical protein
MTKLGVSIQREGILGLTDQSELRLLNARSKSKRHNTRYSGTVPMSFDRQVADILLPRTYRSLSKRSS